MQGLAWIHFHNDLLRNKLYCDVMKTLENAVFFALAVIDWLIWFTGGKLLFPPFSKTSHGGFCSVTFVYY